jgi:hypothetical protein
MEQVSLAVRDMLKPTCQPLNAPQFPPLKQPIFRQLEKSMRADACDHLVDVAKTLLIQRVDAPLHATAPANPLSTLARRLRDLVQERKQLKDPRRYIKGPWNSLSNLAERLLNGDNKAEVSVSGSIDLALVFQPEDGTAHLVAAALARAGGDSEAKLKHLEVAAQDPSPKVRSLAHVNRASAAAHDLLFDEATKHLRVAQVYDEGSPWLPYGSALFSFAAGATREAKRHLQSLAETLQRFRRAEDLRKAIDLFLPSDTHYLASAQGLSPVALAHFRHMAGQTLGASEEGSPQRLWNCTVTLALFELP